MLIIKMDTKLPVNFHKDEKAYQILCFWGDALQ